MSSDEGSVAPAGHGYGATLWEPDAETVRNARISHYMRWLADRGVQAGNPGAPAGPGSAAPAAVYQRLWEWSVANPGEFWTSIWDYFDVLGDRGDGPALTGTTMPDVHWFPDATLNYARNALRTAWTDPDRPADHRRVRTPRHRRAQLRRARGRSGQGRARACGPSA